MLLALLAAATAHAADLAPLKPLVGACWRAELTSTASDTHCFEPMYGGAHVRDRHEVREGGKVVYAGETIYSVDGSDVVFTYVNSLGGVGQGKLHVQGSVLSFAGSMRASPDQSQLQPMDSEWHLIDASRYEVLSKGGGAEKPVTFTRVAEQPPR